MRVLVINDRYFLSGGPERYFFSLISALQQRGHDVISLGNRYGANRTSNSDHFRVEPNHSRSAVYYRDHNKSAWTSRRSLERLFYSREVEHALGRAIEQTKPDVALVLEYLRKLSPSILVELRRHSVPTIVRSYVEPGSR